MQEKYMKTLKYKIVANEKPASDSGGKSPNS
jgi:hypothetical protein